MCAFVVALAALLSACGGPGTTPGAPAPGGDQTDATFEEAALVALGEMFRRYGTGADPLPVDVTGEVVTHRGRGVWRIDGAYAVTVDGRRRTEQWILLIGSTADEPLAVLSAVGPGR